MTNKKQPHEVLKELVDAANSISIIQAENPDGDSLGTALALEEVLGELNKEISLYCPVDIPKYLRYITGWDRVDDTLNTKADLAIIIDTQAQVLLSKVYEAPGARHFLETRPVLVIDHHETEGDLDFSHTLICSKGASTSEILYGLIEKNGWQINQTAAQNMLAATLSDTLGLTTQSVTEYTFLVASKLTGLGASPAALDSKRREFMKKSPEILNYKGELIERIEYYDEGKLALVHIPWEDIKAYSDQYNPSVLVLDEMRLVIGVEVAIAIKTYPDGKLTGKLRTNLPIADTIAGYFGGGGHAYAAGFRTYDDYQTILEEVIKITHETINSYEP